jgi:hypothetical protein
MITVNTTTIIIIIIIIILIIAIIIIMIIIRVVDSGPELQKILQAVRKRVPQSTLTERQLIKK